MTNYGKCPKILNTKLPYKMAYVNRADTEQTALEQSDQDLVLIYTVCHSTKYFKQQVNEKQNLGQNSMVYKVLKILGHLL